jgi:hypothetical protein
MHVYIINCRVVHRHYLCNCLHIISLLVETSVPLVHETMDTVSEETLGFDLVVACLLYSHVHDENHYTIGKLQYVTYTAVRDIHCSM